MRDKRANLCCVDRVHPAAIACPPEPGGRRGPEWIKIEPVARGNPPVMFGPINIAFRPLLDLLGAVAARQRDFVGKLLEKNFVTVPAAIETEKENNGAMHDPGEQNRSGGKCRGGTKKFAAWRLIGAGAPAA